MTKTPALELHPYWTVAPADGWLMSDWPAGQSSILHWSHDHVRTSAEGHVQLLLAGAPPGGAHAAIGGEVQSAAIATTGTWGWTAQAPQMVPGAVFGLFTYLADWQHPPWVEFDFEFAPIRRGCS